MHPELKSVRKVRRLYHVLEPFHEINFFSKRVCSNAVSKVVDVAKYIEKKFVNTNIR